MSLPSRNRGEHFLFDDNISESSFELPNNEIPIHLLISDGDLQMILEEQSMEDFPLPKKLPPEEEVRLLRRLLLDKTQAPPAPTTITRILLGKPCNFEHYKSLSDKEELLDEAISSGNGDAILSVVLFLVNTLKKTHLNRLLQSRPIAVNHYLNYLTTRLKISEATDLLIMLGRNHDATMMQFQVFVTSTSNIEVRKQKLKQMYSNYFTQPGCNVFYSVMISNYINLLEWQSAEKTKDTNILNASVLRTLYYISEKQSPTMTPQQFAELYNISAPQYQWITLNERAKSQAWLDIQLLFENKSWTAKFKTKSFQIHIPLERTILQLHSLSAPAAILNQFLSHVDDPQRRLMLSKRVNAVRSEIDSLVLLKDKAGLESLRDRLDQASEERFYADNAIKNFNSKWKTDGIKLLKN